MLSKKQLREAIGYARNYGFAYVPYTDARNGYVVIPDYEPRVRLVDTGNGHPYPSIKDSIKDVRAALAETVGAVPADGLLVVKRYDDSYGCYLVTMTFSFLRAQLLARRSVSKRFVHIHDGQVGGGFIAGDSSQSLTARWCELETLL